MQDVVVYIRLMRWVWWWWRICFDKILFFFKFLTLILNWVFWRACNVGREVDGEVATCSVWAGVRVWSVRVWRRAQLARWAEHYSTTCTATNYSDLSYSDNKWYQPGLSSQGTVNSFINLLASRVSSPTQEAVWRGQGPLLCTSDQRYYASWSLYQVPLGKILPEMF